MFAEPNSAVAWTVWIHDSALIIVACGGTRDLDVMLADSTFRESLRFLWADVSNHSARALLLFDFGFDHAGGRNESHKIVVSQISAPLLQVAEQAHYPV
jgi:hypothetical protein